MVPLGVQIFKIVSMGGYSSQCNSNIFSGLLAEIVPSSVQSSAATLHYYLVDEHNNCNYPIKRLIIPAHNESLPNLIAALFGMFLETYEIAFSQAGWSRRSAVIESTISCIFGLDVIVNFNLAYYDERDKIVLARLPIAVNYLKRMFWVDLIGVFPFYYVALAISGQMGESNTLTQTLSLLRLFTLF
eukprot:scaffold32222_cov161-Skeletonema_dohrnii-CCMP3373.AAC.2